MSNLDIAAIIAAGGTAIGTVAAALKGSSDGKGVKDRLDAIDLPTGLIATLKRRVEELAGLVDPALRADLDALAEKVRAYRAEQRRGAAPAAVTGAFPAAAAPPDTHRLDDLERRVVAAEARASKNEERLDKLDAWWDDARVMIARIETHLEHLIGRRSGGDR